MRKIITGLFIIFVLSGGIPAHSKLVDIKRFVHCAVGTEVDDATRAQSPRLICLGKSDTSKDRAVVILTCTHGVFATILQAGTQSHAAETIDVSYRFDMEKLSTEPWGYTNNRAVNLVKGVHHRFLEGIDKAQQLSFEVGKEAGSVNLKGSADAVTEYKKVCAALGRPIK